MRILEKILGLLIAISITMRYFDLAGSYVISSVLLLIIATIYYILGFAFFNQIRLRKVFHKASYNRISALRIIGAIGIGMTLSTLCIGIMFKTNNWPGGNNIILIGLVCSIVILIMILVRYSKTKNQLYMFMIKRILIIGGIGTFLLFIQGSYLKDQPNIDSELIRKELIDEDSLNPFEELNQNKLKVPLQDTIKVENSPTTDILTQKYIATVNAQQKGKIYKQLLLANIGIYVERPESGESVKDKLESYKVMGIRGMDTVFVHTEFGFKFSEKIEHAFETLEDGDLLIFSEILIKDNDGEYYTNPIRLTITD